MVSNIAESLNFAPVSAAKKFTFENKDKESIFITGNTVIDALSTTVQNGGLFQRLLINLKGKRSYFTNSASSLKILENFDLKFLP